MGYTNGYIKLWRKSLTSDVWKNPTLWRFWTWCLMKATYQECDCLVGRTFVHLLPGQFVFGRRKAALEIGISEPAIRSAIKTLQMLGNITVKPTNKFSIVTVVKWGSYQSTPNGNAPTDDPTDDPTTAPADAPQRKKGKEVLEKGKEDTPAPGSNLHDWTITFGRWWGALKHVNASAGYLGVLDPFFTTERRFEFAKFKIETDDLGRYHGLLKPWQLRDMLWDDLKGYREHQAEGAKAYRAWQGKAGKLVEDVAAAIGERTAEATADRTARKPKGG